MLTTANLKNRENLDTSTITKLFTALSDQQKQSLSGASLKQLLAACKLPLIAAEQDPPFPQRDTEISISVHHNREFGMVLSAGMGGNQAQLYRDNCRSGLAMSCCATASTSGADFLTLFKQGIAFKKLQHTTPACPEPQLETLFEQLIRLANHFSPANPDATLVITELTLNPISFHQGTGYVTSAHCQVTAPTQIPAPRPIKKIDKMLHPESISIIGVSATKMNFGRIILKNLIDSGYDKNKMRIVRPESTEIDGVACIENLSALDHKLDLFIVAVAAEAVFDLVDNIIRTDAAESVMLIPGGLGETEASREQAARMSEKINEAHRHGDGGPIFLGGNCLGIVSHPGGYDSWFIPKFKLPNPQKKGQRNSALISQSGAFMITRISQNPWFDPNYMTALGNQNDLTHSDMVNYLADKPEIDLIGVYVEGFKPLDGFAFTEAVRHAALNGKQVVVYKAGQTQPGQTAALGHTASIAGDYAICVNLLHQAGALVAQSLTEFNDLFYIADCMHNKKISGNRLGAVSGAGFETVGMADSIHSDHFSLQMGKLEPETYTRLAEILKAKRLDALMEIHNPFDINPGADDEAHVLCTQAFAEDPNIDAVVVGLDPLSPMMRTLPESPRPGFDINSEESITQQLPALVDSLDKPIIGIVDGGPLYDPMIEMLKDKGVCTFRSCDQGVRALTKYIETRLKTEQIRKLHTAD